jgi:hypothetical protein
MVFPFFLYSSDVHLLLSAGVQGTGWTLEIFPDEG